MPSSISLNVYDSWFLAIPFFLLLHPTIFFSLKQTLYLVTSLSHSPTSLSLYISNILSQCISVSLITFAWLYLWFTCSSAICQSTHSLYITVTLCLYLTLPLYQSRRRSNTIQPSSLLATSSWSVFLYSSPSHIVFLSFFFIIFVLHYLFIILYSGKKLTGSYFFWWIWWR